MSEPAAVDLFSACRGQSVLRATWAERLASERGLPAHRIIHSRIFRPHRPTRITRIGLRRPEKGYMKCGSFASLDWVTALRIHVWDGSAWRTVREMSGLALPKKGETDWLDLGDALREPTPSLILEVRDAGTDIGWPGWNLVSSAFALEGHPGETLAPRDRKLTSESVELGGCPRGVEARQLPGEVRFKTRWLEVGFRLGRAGFAYLAVDDEGQSRTHRNLLPMPSAMPYGMNWADTSLSDLLAQGPRLWPVGAPPILGFLPHDVRGSASVRGNVVTYDIESAEAGQRYRLRWEVLEDRMNLHAERVGERAMRAWDSCAWNIAFSSAVTATANIGRITRVGETGLMHLPVLVHSPGHGTFRVEADRADSVLWRFDSWRPSNITTGELKLGETPTAIGDYVLEPGRHEANVTFAVTMHKASSLRPDTPAIVRRGVERTAITSLTYRPDTATFTNNANSMHAMICADCWSATTTRIGPVLPNLDAVDLMRDTLERWLDGGPGYAGGRLAADDEGRAFRYAEDEYIMTGAVSLLGLADYLRAAGTSAWLERFAKPIDEEIERMRNRDLDGDGLLESDIRQGVSGKHQWSTCWYDVLSFGWKDAFSNALLYPALVQLAEHFPRLGYARLANHLSDWAARLRKSYVPTFLNPATGWLAGWKCKENKLHDHAYLFVNGAAVVGGLLDDEMSRQIVRKLWDELMRIDPHIDFRMGMPGALWSIPATDTALPMPEGVYMNKTLNHSQSRHFLGAMYKVGMTNEADAVLDKLMESLGDGSVFGGCGSGADWRRWSDGAYSGYEGLLTDQFGVLAIAYDRYSNTVKR